MRHILQRGLCHLEESTWFKGLPSSMKIATLSLGGTLGISSTVQSNLGWNEQNMLVPRN